VIAIILVHQASSESEQLSEAPSHSDLRLPTWRKNAHPHRACFAVPSMWPWLTHGWQEGAEVSPIGEERLGEADEYHGIGVKLAGAGGAWQVMPPPPGGREAHVGAFTGLSKMVEQLKVQHERVGPPAGVVPKACPPTSQPCPCLPAFPHCWFVPRVPPSPQGRGGACRPPAC
jgi:hypothetical protein